MHTAMNPATGEPIARVKFGSTEDYETCLTNMTESLNMWKSLPAPRFEFIQVI
jgi:acyl-CoA reductase-like NAD-dependent aldehyde dehydrogenase